MDFIEKILEIYSVETHPFCQDYSSAIISNSIHAIEYEILDKENKEKYEKVVFNIKKAI